MAAKEAAAQAAAATNTAVANVADTAVATPMWRWSISEAWDELGHAWKGLIHVPYLGLIALAIVIILVGRAVSKLVR